MNEESLSGFRVEEQFQLLLKSEVNLVDRGYVACLIMSIRGMHKLTFKIMPTLNLTDVLI